MHLLFMINLFKMIMKWYQNYSQHVHWQSFVFRLAQDKNTSVLIKNILDNPMINKIYKSQFEVLFLGILQYYLSNVFSRFNYFRTYSYTNCILCIYNNIISSYYISFM